MSLSINHNLMALNTARHLDAHYARLSVSMRRLSSGLRVSSAADDAAGLAIRELMRADIAGLRQGIRNVNDAISMIQTADGALGVIDEKLIRMKELAEQAATGTYDSTQRLIIHSEFQQMAMEIDRIANATDFNGIKLLDGSLAGEHDGSGLVSTGAMKIHFGTGNDSAEDYYHVNIGDATLAGLGLSAAQDGDRTGGGAAAHADGDAWVGTLADAGMEIPELMDGGQYTSVGLRLPFVIEGGGTTPREYHPPFMQDVLAQGTWYTPVLGIGPPQPDPKIMIPKGTKNIALIIYSTDGGGVGEGDNDIQLFAMEHHPSPTNRFGFYSLVHLAGTPLKTDTSTLYQTPISNINDGSYYVHDLRNYQLGDYAQIDMSTYDYNEPHLNTGPSGYDPTGNTLKYTTYNGMTIGYSGDGDQHDSIPNDGILQDWGDYEILTIDEAKSDLVIAMPGFAGVAMKMYWNLPDSGPGRAGGGDGGAGQAISVHTQDLAQKALERIDNAIIKKDKIRAHLGALQNRFENTVTNLAIQAENLQASESRISDADVATEMTEFVRSRILSQSGTAMLAQANSLPQMLVSLIEG